MEITEVRVFPVDEDKLKAYASIVVDACFIVNDLKIIQGKKGLFISMPSRRRKRGGYRDVAHPLNNETRGLIEERVLAEYVAALERGDGAVRDVDDYEGEVATPTARQLPAAAAPPAPAGEASPPAEPAVAAAETPPPRAAVDEADPQSLEEIERLHLRDSFWSVT